MWNGFGAATFSQFVSKICDVYPNEGLTKGVGDVYPCSRLLLYNQYVFQPFWDLPNIIDQDYQMQEGKLVTKT